MSAPTPTPVRGEIDEIDYPTGDGQPVAETPVHRDNLLESIAMLRRWYAGREDVYVSGNMFVYYVKGDRRRHVAPDVFVVEGVPPVYRDCYKTWEEPKSNLDLVVEYTSRSTKEEDLEDKFELYRDELRVREYMLFDPYAEYLDPPEQLFRLLDGQYRPVAPVNGRLPSEVLGLHFERQGTDLRLYVPSTGLWVPSTREIELDRDRLEAERNRLEAERRQLADKLTASDAEIERLRRELEALRQTGPGTGRKPKRK
jgi:Uma2 family endonuclease